MMVEFIRCNSSDVILVNTNAIKAVFENDEQTCMIAFTNGDYVIVLGTIRRVLEKLNGVNPEAKPNE